MMFYQVAISHFVYPFIHQLVGIWVVSLLAITDNAAVNGVSCVLCPDHREELCADHLS